MADCRILKNFTVDHYFHAILCYNNLYIRYIHVQFNNISLQNNVNKSYGGFYDFCVYLPQFYLLSNLPTEKIKWNFNKWANNW